jgi:hypothetical protein
LIQAGHTPLCCYTYLTGSHLTDWGGVRFCLIPVTKTSTGHDYSPSYCPEGCYQSGKGGSFPYCYVIQVWQEHTEWTGMKSSTVSSISYRHQLDLICAVMSTAYLSCVSLEDFYPRSEMLGKNLMKHHEFIPVREGIEPTYRQQ